MTNQKIKTHPTERLDELVIMIDGIQDDQKINYLIGMVRGMLLCEEMSEKKQIIVAAIAAQEQIAS